MGNRFFITALTGERIVNIGQGNYLSCDRDCIAYQTIGIAATIIALMMPTTDLISCVQKLGMAIGGDTLQDVGTCHGVSLHDGKFFICQTTGLVQNLFINGDFTDIVYGRCGADPQDIAGGQLVAVSHLYKMLQQDRGHRLNVVNMHAALTVTELNDLSQYGDHEGVVLLFFVDLLLH